METIHTASKRSAPRCSTRSLRCGTPLDPEGRFEELGHYTVAFEEFSEGGDFAPLFRGLPDDRCQSWHWGIVVKGKLTITYADGQDVVEASEPITCRLGTTPAADPRRP